MVPPMVNFTGVVLDSNGEPRSGLLAITFSLYAESQGGAPLWMETQNVTVDRTGHYSVMLGSTKSTGLPADPFISGQARWLGVQAQDQVEQSRMLLLSVPYATLKSADAETVGGLPPSAFVLAAPPNTNYKNATNANRVALVSPATSSDVTTTGGKANTIPLFTTATNIQNSIVTQTGTTTINVVGKLNLPAAGTATASGGKNSRPETMVASVSQEKTPKAEQNGQGSRFNR